MSDFEEYATHSTVGRTDSGLVSVSSNVVSRGGSWETADTQLLRAASVSSVLHRGGKCLANASGNTETYEKSLAVERIGTFISHNWSVPRFAKFLVLALHFNFRKAVASMYLSAILVLLLRVLVDLPILYWPVGHQGVDYCAFAGLLAFFAWTFFGHDVCRESAPLVFLDKFCIHQTDAALKAQGIAALPSFVLSSSEMLIVQGDEYLRKLWTVYELASFLLLNPTAKLRPLPLHLPRFVFGLMAFSIVFMYTHIEMVHLKDLAVSDSHTGHGHGDASHASDVFIAICAAVIPMTVAFLVLAVESYMRAQKRVYDTVQLFDIRNAKCFQESDRDIVECSVVDFMKVNMKISSAKELETDPVALREELLDEFNRIAKEKTPEALTFTFGRVGLPYKYACLIFSVFVLRDFDTLAISINAQVPAHRICLSLAVTAFRAFALWPCWLGLICSMCLLGSESHRCISYSVPKCERRCLTRRTCTSLLRISAGFLLFVTLWAMDMFLFTDLVTLDVGSGGHHEHEGHGDHDDDGHGGHQAHDHGEYGKQSNDAGPSNRKHDEDEHNKDKEDHNGERGGYEHEENRDDDMHSKNENGEHEHDGHDEDKEEIRDEHGDNKHEQHEEHGEHLNGERSDTLHSHDLGGRENSHDDRKAGSQLSHGGTAPQPAQLIATLCAVVLILCLLAWLWGPLQRCHSNSHAPHTASAPSAPWRKKLKMQAEHPPDQQDTSARCVALEEFPHSEVKADTLGRRTPDTQGCNWSPDTGLLLMHV